MPKSALTRGAHHVGMTVPDPVRTRAFFVQHAGPRSSRRSPGLRGRLPYRRHDRDYPMAGQDPGVRRSVRSQERRRAASSGVQCRWRGCPRCAARYVNSQRRRRCRVCAGAARQRAGDAHDMRDPGRHPRGVHRGRRLSWPNPGTFQELEEPYPTCTKMFRLSSGVNIPHSSALITHAPRRRFLQPEPEGHNGGRVAHYVWRPLVSLTQGVS